MKTSLPCDSGDRLRPNHDPELNKWRKTDGWYEDKLNIIKGRRLSRVDFYHFLLLS